LVATKPPAVTAYIHREGRLACESFATYGWLQHGYAMEFKFVKYEGWRVTCHKKGYTFTILLSTPGGLAKDYDWHTKPSLSDSAGYDYTLMEIK